MSKSTHFKNDDIDFSKKKKEKKKYVMEILINYFI